MARCIVHGDAKEIPNITRCTKMGKGVPQKGAHGGWLLSKDKCYILDAGLARHVATHIPRGQSIADLGAGLGCYTQYMRHYGANISVALDFAIDINIRTHNQVQRWNLGIPFPFLRPPDWTFSIEVAEHIPTAFTEGFVTNVAAARCGAIVSWASPGQRGSGHVNLKSKADVSRLLEARNMYVSRTYTTLLQKHSRVPWVRANIGVYLRDPYVSDCAWLK